MAKVVIGGDHAGFEYKYNLIDKLVNDGHEVQDVGTYSEESVDYPDFAHKLTAIVAEKKADFGVLICGSGNGVAMSANKNPQVRAALCWLEELASLARQHNDANVICLPARFISYALAEKCVQIFLSTAFEGGRHARRVDKISC